MELYKTETEHPNEVVFNEDIKEKCFTIYKPDGTILARSCNILAFNDARIQIKQKKLSGYKVSVDGSDVISEIDNTGHVKKWPEGLGDLMELQLDILIGLGEY